MRPDDTTRLTNDELTGDLDLTDEQRATIGGYIDAARQGEEAFREHCREHNQAITSLVGARTFILGMDGFDAAFDVSQDGAIAGQVSPFHAAGGAFDVDSFPEFPQLVA